MTDTFNTKNGIHYLIGYRLEWDTAFDPAEMPKTCRKESKASSVISVTGTSTR